MTRNNLTRDEARRRGELITDLRYRITLDLTGSSGFRSESVATFACSEPGAATFMDLTAPAVESMTLNGRELPQDAFDGNRIRLDHLEERNEILVVGRCDYNRTEMGMHRFEDPLDGMVYLHTHLEPFGAHRAFACFDQPDLKAPYDFAVVVPAGWEVISNAKPASRTEERSGAERWTFERTPPIPAYITAVCAGPYHASRDQHRGIDLGLFCRRSLAQFLDAEELLEITRQGLDFFEPAFGYPYMFGGKYDQVFVPESNSGAMENAACITFNDVYLFRSRVTDAARERRAETILHEMAHMWFGDLVTMSWWDDLWLNESFASYMAVFAQVGATRWTDAWTTFADSEKTWAYRQDQLPTTHPIVADIPDVESIHLNFDGITYAKGASVLKQLVAWVGREPFLDGIKAYCRRHEYANASLEDFLSALSEASGRDLHAWSKEWLQSAGVNTLRPSLELRSGDKGEEFASFSILQEAPEEWPTLRSHRVAVGLYDPTREGLIRRRRVELDVVGGRTEIPDLRGEPVPALILVNDDDLTFAKIRLDERSLATAIERLGELADPLARTLCWTACWDMTRDGEMRSRDYVRLVVRNIGRETKVGVVQSLLAQASSAVNLYGDPANREAAGAVLAEAALAGLRAAPPASDHQLAWARAFISAARTREHLSVAQGLLDGSIGFPGLSVDTELRWHLVRALAAAGSGDRALIDTEERSDPTDRGARHAAAALAARPSAEAKDAAWLAVTGEGKLPLAMADEIMASFAQFGQDEILEPYAERYFDVLRQIWEKKDLPDAIAFARRMYPNLIVKPETIERTNAALAGDGLAGPLRRLLLEGRDGVERTMRARAADARGA